MKLLHISPSDTLQGALHKLREGGNLKDTFLQRPYLILKKDDKRGGGQKLPILRGHSLWTTSNFECPTFNRL